MEADYLPQWTSEAKCCDCECSSCSMKSGSFSETCLRSIKRKYDEAEEENMPQNARVEIENECMALRETVISQQQTIKDLIMELEEERNASSSAANEAMSMILRLQREKAEVQMEARQFKRFADEKMEHDQQETLALDDLLYKKEQTLQSLTCEVQAYKHRMMSFGLTESEAGGEKLMSRNTSVAENLEGLYEFPSYEVYPSLKCNINESRVSPDGDDETKYPFGETPLSTDQLKDLEYRINELEQSPRSIDHDRNYYRTKNMLEKVIVDQPSRPPKEKTVFSHLDLDPNFRKVDKSNTSEVGDETSDRIYTIDSIHQEPPVSGGADHKASVASVYDDYNRSPRDSLIHSDVADLEVQKLYARLQALEADRESMRQAIVSFGTDKAQLVLLREIAENLCKEMAPARAMVDQKKPAKKNLSSASVFKLATSCVSWRRKARRSKYTFGMSAKNEGLLSVLDRGPRIGQRRVVSAARLRPSGIELFS